MMFRTTEEFNKGLHEKAVSSKLQLGGAISKGVEKVAPYASNIVNMFRTLPQVQAPELNKNFLTPKLVNYDADVNETERLIRGLDAGITTANGATGNALKVANLGKFLEQRNRLKQNQRNTNAGIINQARQVNLGIEEGNIERLNDYKRALTERGVAGQRLQSENLANFSDKFQMQKRDEAQIDLEKRKLELLPTLFKDNKVLTRNMLEQVNAERAKFNLPPLTHLPNGEPTVQKYGGKLKSNKLSSYMMGGKTKKTKLASLLDYV